MGSSNDSGVPAPPEFLSVFHAHADASGVLPFERFMDLALYHPEVGYYRKQRPRVGYGSGTDFFTASTSGPVFGELVAAASAQLLRAAGRDPANHTFVEIGCEPDRGGVLSEVSHPFGGVRTLGFGEDLALSGSLVVFSNELFDAQPCVRSLFRNGRWRKTGVRDLAGALSEVELDDEPPFVPPAASEGYRFDQPLAAADLVKHIAGQPWQGLFVACDYGKTLRELTEETPQGTVRAYFQHTQTNEILARPGEQDLTCHICWDWMTNALRAHRFESPLVQFQETFFIRHAGEFIARASAAEASRFSQRKLALLQLLHPSHLGQKFQVLHALR